MRVRRSGGVVLRMAVAWRHAARAPRARARVFAHGVNKKARRGIVMAWRRDARAWRLDLPFYLTSSVMGVACVAFAARGGVRALPFVPNLGSSPLLSLLPSPCPSGFRRARRLARVCGDILSQSLFSSGYSLRFSNVFWAT